MKKILSKFSDQLLNNQQLKVVKGGTPYCFTCSGSPVDCPPGAAPGEGSFASRCDRGLGMVIWWPW